MGQLEGTVPSTENGVRIPVSHRKPRQERVMMGADFTSWRRQREKDGRARKDKKTHLPVTSTLAPLSKVREAKWAI